MNAEIIDEIVGTMPVNGSSTRLEVLFQQRDAMEIRVQDWVELSLRTGMPVSRELMNQLEAASQESEATEVAFRFLRLRPRTEAEINRHLEKKEYAEDVRNVVMDRLRKQGLVNDAQYVEMFAEQKRTQMSQMEIGWKLRQRGVDNSLIDAVLGRTLGAETEVETALALGRKQWRRHQGKGLDTCRVKVAQHLQRKGFSMEAIYTVLRKMEAEESDYADS